MRDRTMGGGERGSVLVMSLVAVSTVVVLAASFSQFASSVANRQAHSVAKKRAFYVAEAGLAEAFTGLSQGKSGNVGSAEAPALLGDGVFWVEATELEPGYVRLESTGMIGTGKVVLSLVAERGEDDVSALGVFSGGDVTLSPGSLVDAYDSTAGNYAAQTDKSGAALGSNGDITLTGSLVQPTVVRGDVTSGPEHAVSTSGTVTIGGAQSASLGEVVLPAIEVPDLALEPAQVHSSPYPLVLTGCATGLEGLTVESGAQVIVQGPAEIVLGSLSLQESAELVFDTTQGPIELYVTDALDLQLGSFVTTSGSAPDDVTLLVAAQSETPIALRSIGAFHGVVYAPTGTVVLGENFEVYGALVADELTFEGAAQLHVDRNLAKVAAESALPGQLSWRIVELGNISTDLATDPFDVLGVSKSALSKPAGAHMDQTLAIDYYDASDVYHRYVGLESEFDWNVVDEVIWATRDGQPVLFPRTTSPQTGVRKSPGVLPVVDGPMI